MEICNARRISCNPPVMGISFRGTKKISVQDFSKYLLLA